MIVQLYYMECATPFFRFDPVLSQTKFGLELVTKWLELFEQCLNKKGFPPYLELCCTIWDKSQRILMDFGG